jgi:hypothetical protein
VNERECHPRFFERLASWLAAADVLLSNAFPHGLYLDYFQRYSAWLREDDHVVAVLRPGSLGGTFTHLPQPRPSLLSRLRNRIRRLRSGTTPDRSCGEP